MTGQRIAIAASDGGSFDAWLALPPDGDPPARPAPGVVMLHEIFGVTAWIRETAEMFAAHGYCVVAPDMFWRLEPNFAGDHEDPVSTAKGRQFKARLDHDRAMDDIAAAVAQLKAMPACNGRVAVTGFCTGGTLAYLAAARLGIDAASVYYGTQIHEYPGEGRNIRCPTIFHAGDRDDRVPADLPGILEAAVAGVPGVAVHLYEAGHAFAHTGRPDLHVPAATDLAHARTFALFDRLR